MSALLKLIIDCNSLMYVLDIYRWISHFHSLIIIDPEKMAAEGFSFRT